MSGDVFLVDDNPVNIRLLAETLRQSGHQVRASVSPRHALQTLRAHPPELVLLDVSMPEMDGFQLCEALKADTATRDIPVVFISAHDTPAERARAFRSGGADYIVKPFEPDEIAARVAAQLGLARLERENRALKDEVERLTRELAQARCGLEGRA